MIQRVAVVGAGTMGSGIAQLCSQSGFAVKVFDPVPAALEALPGRLRKGLDAAVMKGKLTTMQADRAFHSVSPAKSLAELEGADIVLEAAIEDLDAKRKLFAELSRAVPDAVLATNTSSLSVRAIAEAAEGRHRVLGVHFFNPPAAMKLVELVRAPETSPEVFQGVWDFVLAGLRRTPVDVKDTPGFIVNRVMRPYYVEAQRRAGAGLAALDKAAREAGVPMGPFELMDLIGLDVNLAITKSIYAALGRPERFVPPALQQKLVDAGCLGRKTGKGFHLYKDGKWAGENPLAVSLIGQAAAQTPAAAWDSVIGAVIAEAELAHSEGVAGKNDIDVAIKLAMNFPKGPFEWRSGARA